MEYNNTEPPFSNKSEAIVLNDHEIVDLVVKWFFENFEDPVEITPYESREGGYQFIWGGPFDARDVIGDWFGGIISDDLIDQIVDRIQDDGLYEWAPHQRTIIHEEAYDTEPFDAERHLQDENGEPITTESGEYIEVGVNENEGEPSLNPQAASSVLDFKTIERSIPIFDSRLTLWNEIRSRGYPQLVVGVITIPRLRQTDASIDLDFLLSGLGWNNNSVLSSNPNTAPDISYQMIEAWMNSAVAGILDTQDIGAFREYTFASPWVSTHDNPIGSQELAALLLCSQAVIRHPFKTGLAILIVGSALCIVSVAMNATDEIGNALGQHIANEFILDRDATSETLDKLEKIMEQDRIQFDI